MLLGFAGTIVLCLLYISTHNSSSNLADGPIAHASPQPAARDDVPVLPPEESAFIEIVTKAQNDGRATENDMQKGGVKAARDRSLCASLTSAVVQNWIGTVKTIDSNSDGKGVLEIEIAPDVTVKTWNNEFSDISTQTLIDPDSPVFKAASAMKTGQRVTFSGTFFSVPGDCLSEASLTLDGKLESPAYIFRFSSIAAY